MNVIKCLIVSLVILSAAPTARAASDLVFVFQKQKDPAELKAAADRFGSLLGKALDRRVRVVVPTDYSASVQALVSGQADVAYMSSLPFLLARRDGGAELLLAEERVDASGKARTDYDSIFVVRLDSKLESVADLVKQSRRLRIAFTSPTSTSGYVFPYRRLIAEGALAPREDPRRVFKRVSFGGSYTQALREVAEGHSDVAAVSDYTLEGPRADVYLPAEQRAKLRILARTSGVPTHLVAVRKGLDPALKTQIRTALENLARTQPKLLADVYGAARFVPVAENEHVAAAIQAIDATGLPIEGLAK
jgi:phosphonate transport system substrate-binding protein